MFSHKKYENKNSARYIHERAFLQKHYYIQLTMPLHMEYVCLLYICTVFLRRTFSKPIEKLQKVKRYAQFWRFSLLSNRRCGWADVETPQDCL
jgi:hypothetical protein